MPVISALPSRMVSFRSLVAVIVGIGAVRLLVAIVMPAEATLLAPDESTYAALARVVATGGDWAAWSSGWGASLYPGGRGLLGPAAALNALGVGDFTAGRIVSVLYAVGAQLLLLAIARLARQRLGPDSPSGLPLMSWPMVGLVVFILLPSNAVWSNLGLREAACTFWALAAVTSTAYLFPAKAWQWKLAYGVLTAVSVSMAFQSRTYLGAALVLALGVGIVWFGRELPRVSLVLAGALVVGSIVGATLSLPAPTPSPSAAEASTVADDLVARSEVERERARQAAEVAAVAASRAAGAQRAAEVLEAADGDVGQAQKLLSAADDAAASQAAVLLSEVSQSPDPAATVKQRREVEKARAAQAEEFVRARSAEADRLGQQAEALLAQEPLAPDSGVVGALRRGSVAATTTINPDKYLQRGTIQREALIQGANSAITGDSCGDSLKTLELRWCEISRLPAAAFTVMFRPLWPLDTPDEWSSLAVLASIENVAWLALVALVAWVLVSRRFSLVRVLTMSLGYGALVVTGMALLEGNLGTAFRHKSNVLWVLCLVLVLSGLARRQRPIAHDQQETRMSDDLGTPVQTGA